MSSSNANQFVELANSVHHLPHGSQAKQRTNPNHWLELTLGVRRRTDLPDLSQLDSVKPAARKYMTRDQLATQYGSDPASVARIESFAKAHNLVVTRDEPASARLGLAGTVADLSAAFGVTLFDYSHPQLGDFHARTGPVHVPSGLENDITGVFGFSNHRILRRKSRVAAHAADMTTKARPWFVPRPIRRLRPRGSRAEPLRSPPLSGYTPRRPPGSRR